MSRVGKKPISIPQGVEFRIEGQKATVKGPKGELSILVRPEIKVESKENKISVAPRLEVKKTNAFWGMTRVLLSNMIKGVTDGYDKKLQIEGIGFRANMEGNNLVLFVGFSHPVKIEAPPGIKFTVQKNIITISGYDKGLVGQIAAMIRRAQPPEPYKGKGVRYFGEVIKKKEGKKAATTAG